MTTLRPVNHQRLGVYYEHGTNEMFVYNLFAFFVLPHTPRTWAAAAYPARRYMLVLGGHGYQFVGAITDYSQYLPYIMGIAEMSAAMNETAHAAGVRLDLVVLDICYFNFVEVMYELGKEAKHAVGTVLIYIDNGPLAGPVL